MCVGGAVNDIFSKKNLPWLVAGLGAGPKWFKDHKDIAIPAALVAATIFTGGAAAPALAGELGAEGAGAGLLGGGMAAGEGLGMLGAGEAGAAFPGLGLGAELGPGAAAGGLAGADEIGAGAGSRSLMGQFGDLTGKYGPQVSKLGKAARGLQQLGLLNQPHPQVAPAIPPGGGPQISGMPTSAQIDFPQAYQQQQPNVSLADILRRAMQQGY